MRSEDGLPAPHQAEGVLELCSAREHGTVHGRRELNGPRHVSAGASQHDRPARDNACHRVVTPGHDVAIVDQEQIGDAAKALERLLVVFGDRFLGQVYAELKAAK